MQQKKHTVDQAEIDHFRKDSARWWDENGPFRPLHRLNPVRMSYIRDAACAHFGRDAGSLSPLKGLKTLDVGCGGGLVCEPLARMGAKATGIDADGQAIAIASEHAAGGGLDIDYRAATTDELAAGKERFDIVLALEVIEHVADVDKFVDECVELCKPGGLLIFSTLNRTLKSFALGIVTAEYFLRWVPQGTHDWRKFVKPSELAAALRRAGAMPTGEKGLIYNPLKCDFYLSDSDIDVNYLMSARKP
jgi:2-polyprenyl-6-hydroxyphenyl methylase/3-demethylubiquinone-9 3-methyltransferase